MEDRQVEENTLTKPPESTNTIPNCDIGRDSEHKINITANENIKKPGENHANIDARKAIEQNAPTSDSSMCNIAPKETDTPLGNEKKVQLSLKPNPMQEANTADSRKTVKQAPPRSSGNLMPKLINTPQGTIPLNTNTDINAKPVKPKKRITPQGQLQTQLQTKPNVATVNIDSNPEKSLTAHCEPNNRSLSALSQTKRSASIQQATRLPAISTVRSVAPSGMRRTASVPTPGNSNVPPTLVTTLPVPIQPNPNTNPNLYFHPIAIRPKPSQPLTAKSRLKSNAGIRLGSPSISTSKDNPKSGGITLTTSKNWVLPPRPKTKKVSKKKEKKPTKPSNTSGNFARQTTIPNANIKYPSIPIASASKATETEDFKIHKKIAENSVSKEGMLVSTHNQTQPFTQVVSRQSVTALPSNTVAMAKPNNATVAINATNKPTGSLDNTTILNMTTDGTKIKSCTDQRNTLEDLPSSNKNVSVTKSGKESNRIKKNPTLKKESLTDDKSKMCTGCTSFISPGIKSVYLDSSTGKVSINAQIHSNINLYTNNEGELEVQLQHVSRENDNLKKILLKLNKEIQNLKLVKEKDETSGTLKKNAKSNNMKNDVKIKLENDNNQKLTNKTKGTTRTGKRASMTKTNDSIFLPTVNLTSVPLEKVKTEKSSMDLDVDMDRGLNFDNKNNLKISMDDTGMDMDVDMNLAMNTDIMNNKDIHNAKIKSEDTDFFNDDFKSSANTIDPVNLSYNLESKRQKTVSSYRDQAHELLTKNTNIEEPLKANKKRNTITKSSSTSRKEKSKGKTNHKTGNTEPIKTATTPAVKTTEEKKNSTSTKKIEYHSCGVCEIGQKCVCFEKQTLSIAATIAQALSRGGVNLLGLGSSNTNSINSINGNMGSILNSNGGLNTLTSILNREEIMKKLKDDDKKMLSNVFKMRSNEMNTNANDKPDLSLAVGGLSGEKQSNENTGGIETQNAHESLSVSKSKNTLENQTNTVQFEEENNDDALLQLIDAELSLDPTPLVSPALLKKPAKATDNNLKMMRSDSKNSEHSGNNGNGMEFFNRGTLMDFNSFIGGDSMLCDDGITFGTNGPTDAEKDNDYPTIPEKLFDANTHTLNDKIEVQGLNSAPFMYEDSAFGVPISDIPSLDDNDDFMIY